MSIDWQAYDDGSLTSEERAHAEILLQSDRRAKAEVEGLRAFKEAIHRAGQAQDVPTASLQAMLREVAPQHRVVSRRSVAAAPLFAAAAAVALGLWFGPRLLQPAQQASPQVAQLSDAATFRSSDPQQLRSWLVSTTHEPAPLVTGSGCSGTMVDAQRGPGWIAWELEMDCRKYTITGQKREKVDLKNADSATYKGMTYIVRGDEVGWMCEMGMVYFVKGGTLQGRFAVAAAARQETPSIVHI